MIKSSDTNPKEAILLLEDGQVWRGIAHGKPGTSIGEICFNTGMTGYQEIFTDPSYFGQIMVMTCVHIGNYGVKMSETESESVKIRGLVCKNFTNEYSRKLADEDLNNYLISNNIIVISDVDTRSIVKSIRSKGAMNAIISSEISDLKELKKLLDASPKMEGLELASKVTTKEVYEYGNPDSEFKIAALDFGIKKSILKNFDNRNCFLRVFPARTSFQELKKWNPDGYFLSNGPGDPAAMDYAVETVKAILKENKPLFGICLGHQILARAIDIPTYKMHHGHRGINHPVKNLITGKCEITSQNHGFGVSPEALRMNEDKIDITHINLNDETIEGLHVKGKKAFSVQYHPEASPGPHDARYLFDQFVSYMKEIKYAGNLALTE